MTEPDLVERLRIKADVITMGERIAWGSETELMRKAADEIERLRDALATSREIADLLRRANSDLAQASYTVVSSVKDRAP